MAGPEMVEMSFLAVQSQRNYGNILDCQTISRITIVGLLRSGLRRVVNGEI